MDHDYCADLGEVEVSFDMDVEVKSVWGESRDMPGGCAFYAAIDFTTAIVHLPEDEERKLSEHPDRVSLTEKLKEWVESYVVDNLSDFCDAA